MAPPARELRTVVTRQIFNRFFNRARGGYIWEHLGPAWVFMIPTLIDLLVRLPLIYTIPETLHRKGDAQEAP